MKGFHEPILSDAVDFMNQLVKIIDGLVQVLTLSFQKIKPGLQGFMLGNGLKIDIPDSGDFGPESDQLLFRVFDRQLLFCAGKGLRFPANIGKRLMIGFGQTVFNMILLQGHPGNLKLQQADILKRFFTLLVNAAERGTAGRHLPVQGIILFLVGLQRRFNRLHLIIILFETVFIGPDLQRSSRDLPVVFRNIAGNLRDVQQPVFTKTQQPSQGVLGVFHLGIQGGQLKLTCHPSLVGRFRFAGNCFDGRSCPGNCPLGI